jgi:hypothetical protein
MVKIMHKLKDGNTNRVLLGTLIILLITGAACIRIVTESDSPPAPTTQPPAPRQPVASIDSIVPPTASDGELVTFYGRGTDSDGAITGYEWRSSLDGILSTKISFSTSTLSIGTHAIYFRVLDNGNLWSPDASGSIVITPKVIKPVINSFTATPSRITFGESSELTWNISNAQTAFIDNGVGPVALIGSRLVSPGVTTLYLLTATGASGNATASVSVDVATPIPAGNPVIYFFTAQHLGGTSWKLQWNVGNATSVVIEPDIGGVSPSGEIIVNTPVNQTYKLTATNNMSGGWTWRAVTILYQ